MVRIQAVTWRTAHADLVPPAALEQPDGTWVAESDHISQRFYAKVGWEPDGAVRTLDTGDRGLRELRLR